MDSRPCWKSVHSATGSRFCQPRPCVEKGCDTRTNHPWAPPGQVGNLSSQRARVNVGGKTSVTLRKEHTINNDSCGTDGQLQIWFTVFKLKQQTCTQRDQIARHLLVVATYKDVRVITFHCPTIHVPCQNGYSSDCLELQPFGWDTSDSSRPLPI